MKCLDLFCKAGGTSRGYQMAGFYVVGVDIESQPRYVGDDFLQADALEILRILIGGGCIIGSGNAYGPHASESGRVYYLSDFSLIAASPPCEFGSESTPMAYRDKHKNYIPETRSLLQQAGLPYAIENVENVRKHLINPVMLCGTMFGLPIWRHRYFETWPAIPLSPGSCCHIHRPITVHSGSHTRQTWEPILCTGGADSIKNTKRKLIRPRESVEVVRWAMEVEWMTQDELTKAIPPAYTKWIGEQMLEMTREIA
jgi:DNA (cytosine-5)-methyltransferase 1